MDPSFNQGIDAWKDFYMFTGTAGATLLGLLFVAVSLRLGLFYMRQVADVLDLAVQTVGHFFYLVLIALLFLIPSQRPIGLALPLAFLGILGLVWLGRLILVHHQVNPSPGRTWWWWPQIIIAGLTYGALIVIAVMLMNGRVAESLYWLIPVNVSLLTMGILNTWLLLAHARASD